MEKLLYIIVCPEMVWQFYYDESGTKHVKELLGKNAKEFIDEQENKKGREQARVEKVERDFYISKSTKPFP